MFHFLGFLFVIVIAILLIGLSVVGSIIRTIFGLGRRSTSSNTSRTQQSYTPQEEQEERTSGSNTSSHKKIFTKEDGEYVDFEEIKK